MPHFCSVSTLCRGFRPLHRHFRVSAESPSSPRSNLIFYSCRREGFSPVEQRDLGRAARSPSAIGAFGRQESFAVLHFQPAEETQRRLRKTAAPAVRFGTGSPVSSGKLAAPTESGEACRRAAPTTKPARADGCEAY